MTAEANSFATMTPLILKNKGVPVRTYKIEQDPQTGEWHRMETGNDEAPWVIADFWVRFDANSLSDMEEEFGSLDGFEKAMQERTVVAIRAAFCSILGWSMDDKAARRAAGLKIIEGEQSRYSAALGVAMSIANGVDPTDGVRMLATGAAQVKKMMNQRDEFVKKQIETAEKAAAEGDDEAPSDSPGTNGQEPGSDLEEASLTQ